MNNNTDDELSSEIKALQQQLKDQVNANNQIKMKLYPLVQNNIEREQLEVRQKLINWNKNREMLVKLLRKKKQKKTTEKPIDK